MSEQEANCNTKQDLPDEAEGDFLYYLKNDAEHYAIESKGTGPKASLAKMRLKAWDNFISKGLPTRQTEGYRTIKLTELLSRSYAVPHPQESKEKREIEPSEIAPHIYSDCRKSYLVFVNGHFQATLSNREALPKKIMVSPLAEAATSYGTFLNNHWSQNLKEETDPFVLLNGALHGEGAFIYVSPNVEFSTPIQILNLIVASNAEEAAIVMPRLQLFIGAHAQISLIHSTAIVKQLGRNGIGELVLNGLTDFTLEENSRVEFIQMGEGPNKSGEKVKWKLDATRAHLKRNAFFKSVNLTNGSSNERYDYRITLDGENGEAQLSGLWQLEGKKEAHVHILMEHRAPHCRSMQLFKGILNDFSRSSFTGKILVRQAAQKTDAFQLNNNLLLGDRAIAITQPNLEIFADDVKASHGATVGQLDSEQLFYMKARGLTHREAQKLLVASFCKEVTDLLPSTVT